MQLKQDDTLYFKVIAPELIGDVKFGSNTKIRGKLVMEVPVGLLAYLDRPKNSMRAEYLAAQGHDISTIADPVGTLRFSKQQVPELGLVNSGSAGQTFKVAPLIFNPDLEITKEQFIEGINWLVKELATPAKRALYHGALVYYVSPNLAIFPVREELSFEKPPAAANSPIGKKKSDD